MSQGLSTLTERMVEATVGSRTAELIGGLLLLDRLKHLAGVARDAQEDDHLSRDEAEAGSTGSFLSG